MSQLAVSSVSSFQHFALQRKESGKYKLLTFETKPEASPELIVSMKKMREIFLTAEVENSHQHDLSARFESWRHKRVEQSFRNAADFKDTNRAIGKHRRHKIYGDHFDPDKQYIIKQDAFSHEVHAGLLYSYLLKEHAPRVVMLIDKNPLKGLQVGYQIEWTFSHIQSLSHKTPILEGCGLEKIILASYLLAECDLTLNSDQINDSNLGTIIIHGIKKYFKIDHEGSFAGLVFSEFSRTFEMNNLFNPNELIADDRLQRHFERVGYDHFVNAIHEFAGIDPQELDRITDSVIAHAPDFAQLVFPIKEWISERFAFLRQLSDDLKANPRNPFIS